MFNRKWLVVEWSMCKDGRTQAKVLATFRKKKYADIVVDGLMHASKRHYDVVKSKKWRKIVKVIDKCSKSI